MQTSIVAPCQWEGRTDDNRPCYIRLRRGWLRVKIGSRGADIQNAVNAEPVFEEYYGTGEEGEVLDFNELRDRLTGVVVLPETCAVEP